MRKGPSYPIDDDWRTRVRDELKARKWSQARLASEIGANPSTISELMSGATNQSPYVPDIHDKFDWSPPLPPRLESSADHLLGIFNRLDETGRARLIERGEALEEALRKK